MGSNLSDTNSMSPRSAGPQSPMLSGSFGTHLQNGEVHKLREELMIAKSKMAEWEGVYTQAKCVSISLHLKIKNILAFSSTFFLHHSSVIA